MKALVLESDGVLVCRESGLPAPMAANEVLVRVKHSGICGSDIPRAFHGKAYHYPLVMGHEFSGLVAEASAASGYAPGDRVVVYPLLQCGSCGPCSTGDYAQCERYDYFGSRRDGGFAEYVSVPAANLFRVPDHVDLLSAAMTEPCAVALHGVGKLHIEPGMTALVIGGGPIGLMVAQWLRVAGCSPIHVADVDGRKLALAQKLGFEPIDSRATDLAATFGNATSGAGAGAGAGAVTSGSIKGAGAWVGTAAGGSTKGADCVVEACGLPSTFLQAIQCAGRFGQIVFMGNIQGSFTVPEKDFSRILRNEITIRGTWNSKVTPRGGDEWTRVLSALDRQIDVRSLVSHTPSLDEGPEIFSCMAAKTEWFNKVVFAI